jgi:hypothetical protein
VRGYGTSSLSPTTVALDTIRRAWSGLGF